MARTAITTWSKTGDWVLPFHTKAEYVPEVGLWLGLSASSPTDLCAILVMCHRCPMVQRVGLDADLPEDWSLKSRTLVNLGARERTLRRIKHKSKCLVADRIEYVL
ncbi:hypothetical protein HU200_030772 [Digitaria exilis]|uniref:Uncharacterized protein n=1 Tax=Digitaria exilis TaxID=1010633 RepID=A0A835EQV6_9POAL|nr:hypothetical protein HU200_030772 [Digitaria exilis]